MYAPQSGEIIGILKQLMAAQKEDEDHKTNHTGLVAAKEEKSLKNDVADTQRSLAADQELAAKLAESCSSQSSEWEERQESRGKRLALCTS